MKIILLVGSLFISVSSFGWGKAVLIPAEQREKVYSFETTLDKKKSFTKIVIWSAKSFGDSNEAVKMKDVDLGIFIAKGNIACEAMKMGNGFGKDQRADFTLEFTVEDKKIELKVSDLKGRSSNAWDDGNRPTKKEEADAAFKECIDPFVEGIKKEIL